MPKRSKKSEQPEKPEQPKVPEVPEDDDTDYEETAEEVEASKKAVKKILAPITKMARDIKKSHTGCKKPMSRKDYKEHKDPDNEDPSTDKRPLGEGGAAAGGGKKQRM
jgi:hypothetical protein